MNDEFVPKIVRCEATGICWQVDYWPDNYEDKNPVVIRRGSVQSLVRRDSFFTFYTVVC